MSVVARGMSVIEAYRIYRELRTFRVNRNYQRKLVWTLEEKRKLVDSILRGYPIPLILLAIRNQPGGPNEFEILDGMQRLNAIFSFIENRFSLNGKYFDVNQLARAKLLVNQGAFKAHTEPDKLLEPNECANFLEYTLAVTEFPAIDESSVNEVFGRINAYGRQLSAQERRQAGVISPFAKSIRQLAAELRGDASMDRLDLADMPEISVSVDGEEEDYGVNAEDTFWCKQGILRRNQLRESEDEQILADLAISMIDDEPFAFSGENLDKYYDVTSDHHRFINERLAIYGVDALKHDIQAVISIIRETIEAVDSTPNALRKIVNPEAGGNPIKSHFYAIFMAFFELCVREEMSPNNSHEILNALTNLHNRLEIARGQVRADNRRRNIDTTKGLIQRFFSARRPSAITTGKGLAISLENALRRSKIETSTFECKQGLVQLNDDRKFDPNILLKIARTICAIANVGPHVEGAIFIGVANDAGDKEKIEKLDNIAAYSIGSRYIVGIERELPYLGQNLEEYKRRIVSYITASGLSEPLKTAVLSKIDCIDYRGKSVICIWIPPQNTVSHISDVVYIRKGSETQEVTGLTQTQAVMSLFEARRG